MNLEGKTVRFFRIFIVYIFMIPSLLLFRAQSIGEFCEAFGKIFTAFGFGNGYFESSFESLGMNGSAIYVRRRFVVCDEPIKQSVSRLGESGRFSGVDRNGSLAPYIDVFVYGGMRCAVLDSAFVGQ